jgi:PAS domain S-box-containing protein
MDNMTMKTVKPIAPQEQAEQPLACASSLTHSVPRSESERLHELQTRQIELQKQNEALQQANADLEASRNRFFDFYEYAPVGYLTVTSQGEIIEANLTATALLGVERKVLLKRLFSDFVVSEDGDRWAIQLKNKLKDEAASGHVELRLTRGGSYFHARLDCAPVMAGDPMPALRVTLIDISQSKQAEEAFRSTVVAAGAKAHVQAGYDLFNKLSKNLPGAVYQFRLFADGRSSFPYASEGLRDIYEFTPADVAEDAGAVFARLHPDDLERMASSIQESASTLNPWHLEYRVRLPRKGERWLLSHSNPEKMADGSVLWHGFTTDITERKQAEEALARSEAMMSTILENVGVFVYLKDSDGHYLYANQQVLDLWGTTKEKFVGLGDEAFFDAQTAAQIREHDRSVLVEGRTIRYEGAYLAKNTGVVATYLTVKVPLRRADGSIFGLCGISTDISERKQAEELQHQSEQHLQVIIDTTPACVKLVARDGTLLEMNRAGLAMIEADSPVGPIGSCVYPIVAPEYRPAFQSLNERVCDLEEAGSLEFEIVGLKGSRRWMETRAVPFRLKPSGEVVQLAVTQDITARKKLEAEMRFKDSRYRAMVELAAPDAIFIHDHDGRIHEVNTQACKSTGYSREELLTMTVFDFVEKFDLPSAQALWNNLNPDLPNPVFGCQRRKDGSKLPVDVHLGLLEFDGQRWYIAFARDATLRKQREQRDKQHLEALAYVTRLGLMGEMAAGIAHEINQPLAAISLYAQVSLNLINAENPDLVKLCEIIDKTQQQALKAGRIIHNLRGFVKHSSNQRSVTGINNAIDGAISLCSDAIKQNNVTLTLELESKLPDICLDQVQIEQVLINLIRNSIESLASLPVTHQHRLTIRSRLIAHNIQVEVEDNGAGIDEDQRRSILTPFYSTKADGMGMGLSISRSLIEAHEGTLHFNSQPEKGTTFYFTLPVQSAQ